MGSWYVGIKVSTDTVLELGFTSTKAYLWVAGKRGGTNNDLQPKKWGDKMIGSLVQSQILRCHIVCEGMCCWMRDTSPSSCVEYWYIGQQIGSGQVWGMWSVDGITPQLYFLCRFIYQECPVANAWINTHHGGKEKSCLLVEKCQTLNRCMHTFLQCLRSQGHRFARC